MEANTSYGAGTSSEVKISLLFKRWNVTIITRGIVIQYSIFLFVLFPAIFLLLHEVRAFEAGRFARLNFSLIEVQRGSSSSCDRCSLSDRARTHCCNKCSVCSVVSSVVPSVEVVTVLLLVWPTGSWHVQIQDIKNLD